MIICKKKKVLFLLLGKMLLCPLKNRILFFEHFLIFISFKLLFRSSSLLQNVCVCIKSWFKYYNNRELVILNFNFYTIHWWNTNRVMLQFKKYSFSSLKQFIIVIHVLIFIVFKTNTSFSLDSLFLFFKSNFLKSRFSVDWVCLFVCLSVC